jgi:hypothetical protein
MNKDAKLYYRPSERSNLVCPGAIRFHSVIVATADVTHEAVTRGLGLGLVKLALLC